MAMYCNWVKKIFTIPRKGRHHCYYCCEKITVIHNRYGKKVRDSDVKFCFHCGRKFR